MKNSASDNIAVILSVLQFNNRATLEHDFSCIYIDFIKLCLSGLSLNNSVIAVSTISTSSSSKYCRFVIGTLYIVGRLAFGSPLATTEFDHIFSKTFVSIIYRPPPSLCGSWFLFVVFFHNSTSVTPAENLGSVTPFQLAIVRSLTLSSFANHDIDILFRCKSLIILNQSIFCIFHPRLANFCKLDIFIEV